MDIFYIGTWKTQSSPARVMVFCRNPVGYCRKQGIALPGNLSFLKLDRQKNLLYVLSNGDPEIQNGCGGVLCVFAVQPDGSLTPVQKASTYGAEPIELVLLEEYIALVNHGSTTNRVCRTERQPDGSLKTVWVYDEASLILLERLPDGTVGKLLDQYLFVGHGEIPFFQESAAPHSICYSEQNNRLLVPERGSERTSLFSIQNNRVVLEAELAEKKYYGPRNAVMTRDGRHIYVADEIIPSITHYSGPCWDTVQRVYTVSQEAAAKCDTDPRRFTAPHPVALWLSQDERFLYSLTRSTETLSVFRRDVQTGSLTMIQEWVLSGANSRQALVDENRLYIVLMDAQKLVELSVDASDGFVLEEHTLLDGIASIAAVDGM